MTRHDATLTPAKRASLGAHYTPATLARKVTARALQPLLVWPGAMQCAQCTPSVALTNILVIDPACGDGVFLSAAADWLATLLFQAYAEEGLDRSLEEAREVVEQECLLGIDIDPGAVEAAREALPRTEFDCRDALLDWDFDTQGRPCAFLGNPPFLGGGKISGSLGKEYQKRLVAAYPPANGKADLCAYFFLLAAHTLDVGGSKGTTSFIATNTISQGDTREAGLRFLLQEFGQRIYCADTNVPWPGAAKVTTSIVHLANNQLAWELWPEDMLQQAIHWGGAWPRTPPPIEELVRLRRRPVPEKRRPVTQQGSLF